MVSLTKKRMKKIAIIATRAKNKNFQPAPRAEGSATIGKKNSMIRTSIQLDKMTRAIPTSGNILATYIKNTG